MEVEKDELRKQNRCVWLCSLDENRKLAETGWYKQIFWMFYSQIVI